MKFVMLVDGSKGNFEKMVDIAEEKQKESLFIDTKNCNEIQEYEGLLNNINDFSQSTKEIMLVKFSGRESVIETLGNESPEMIISLSYNKNSKYYTEHPVDMFLDLVTIFEEET
jgi:hypothetical protein